jgi:mRNA-degrading endonuclease toxin of MazEF toxin-antitoxin module
VRRGDVWWGTPPLPGGSRKRRPFLVVSADAFNRNDRYPTVMVVHLTTTHRSGDSFPWEVEVPRGIAGLDATSTVKCNEVYTLLKMHLEAPTGTLPRSYLERVDGALALSLGLGARR